MPSALSDSGLLHDSSRLVIPCFFHDPAPKKHETVDTLLCGVETFFNILRCCGQICLELNLPGLEKPRLGTEQIRVLFAKRSYSLENRREMVSGFVVVIHVQKDAIDWTAVTDSWRYHQ
ncbi:hypothetical protein J6590_029963 [Homalodisca vitripennis]|nr:hypothetical protein J6590_029963 [Homalodisca vitripennis]